MAKLGLDIIQQRSQEMWDENKELRDFLEEIEGVIHGDWSLPEGLDLDWMIPVPSTDPASALGTATRTLSIERPDIFITPTGPGEGEQKTVNTLEKWFRWQLQQADLRSDEDTIGDISRSSLRYDLTAVQVIHMRQQLEALEDAQKEHPNWYKDVQHYGDFAIRVANPKNVAYKRSIWGLEAVLYAYETTAMRLASEWRGSADEIKEEINRHGEDFKVIVYDYTDRDQRAIWATPGIDDVIDNIPDGMPQRWVLVDEERKLPFIPWAIRSGGTALEADPIKKVEPLLGRIVASGLWDLQNTILSLTYSEAIHTAAAPRFAIIGPNGDIVKVDYHDPAKLMPIPPNHTIQELGPRPIDEGLLHLTDRVKARMDRETVARFLQNLDLPEGVAYASINAVMQAAISALDKYKKLAERTIADIFRIMAMYIFYREEVSVAYGGSMGKQVTLKWNHFDPDALYIEVELSAHAPTDYMQRINAATAMNQQLQFPLERAYRFLGVNDPTEVMDEWAEEQLKMSELRGIMTRRKAEQQMRMQAEMQQYMAQQQQQQQQGPPEQGFAQNPGTMRGRQPRRGVPGGKEAQVGRVNRDEKPRAERGAFEIAQKQNAAMGFNPAMGGMPANTVNPGGTRERITGQTRQGDDVVT